MCVYIIITITCFDKRLHGSRSVHGNVCVRIKNDRLTGHIIMRHWQSTGLYFMQVGKWGGVAWAVEWITSIFDKNDDSRRGSVT